MFGCLSIIIWGKECAHLRFPNCLWSHSTCLPLVTETSKPIITRWCVLEFTRGAERLGAERLSLVIMTRNSTPVMHDARSA